jgi:hypothetical protein
VVPFRPGDTPRHAIMSLPLDHPHIKHRSTDSTLRYIHLSGRELSEKLATSMSQIHAWRVSMLTSPVACAAPGGDPA